MATGFQPNGFQQNAFQIHGGTTTAAVTPTDGVISDPVRLRALTTAIVAAGCFFVGAAPFPETVSADRFAYETSQPTFKSRPGLPTAAQQSIVYIGADPFPERVTADRWAYQTAQPTYAKPRIYPDSVSMPGIGAPVGFYGVTPDRLDSRRLPTASQQSVIYIGASPFPETISADRWAYPTGQPTPRSKPGLPAGEQNWIAYDEAAPFPETVSADRWSFATSQPTLRTRQVQPDSFSYSNYIVAVVETVTVDKWYVELSGPQRFRAGLPVREQQSVAFAHAAPFGETVNLDKWYSPLSEPSVKYRLRLSVADQIAVVADPFVRGVTLQTHPIYPHKADGRAFPAREQQSTAYIGAAPFEGVTPAVTVTTSTGGAWYPTPEEMARARAYWKELEEAHEIPRRKRRKLEQDLSETIRKAYLRAVGEEPEIAEEFVAAVAEVAPKAIRADAPTVEFAELVVDPIDWALIGRDLGAMKQLMGVIEARAAAQVVEAFRQAAIERMQRDEEDAEVLLLVF